MSVLAVQRDEGGVRAALLEDGRLCAYRGARDAGRITAGQIYLAVCDRALKQPKAAFLRLPGGESGFLPAEGALSLPASGQAVMAQVKRAPTGGKKAFMTRDIALAGQYLLLLPLSRGVAVSSRVTDAQARQSLKKRGEKLCPPGMRLVMRSSALSEDSQDALQSELSRLLALWGDITRNAAGLPAPSLLWGGEDAVAGLIREEYGRLEYVLTNDASLLPPLPCPVRTAENPFLLLNVEHKLAHARRRTVLMKSGATLVTDRCEAMTVIDVNTGQNTHSEPEKVNAEAACECARLMRLLNLGGMILIDFIDMPDDAARSRLTSAMAQLLARDPVKTMIHGITPLGIMELTRRRADEALSPMPDIPCPHCHGTGVLLADIADTESEESPCDG